MLAQVLTEYRGKVRVAYKDFPLSGHTLARPAHEAARCAGAQGQYWPYHDRLFQAQPDFQRSELIRYATDLGISATSFTQCLDSGRFRARVEADVAEGQSLRVEGTPTFFINGERLEGAAPFEAFKEIIDAALEKAGRGDAK